jgi:nucleoside-diphosphate-sugar epimerase
MATPRVLMTGATGSFGRYVAAELLAAGCELMVLVRGRDEMDARRRAHQAIGFPQRRLRVLHGDVTEEGLGLGRAGRAVARSAEVILHAAAATDSALDLDAARRINFEGTRNVLAAAHRIPGLQKVVHVSAASVAGKRCGHVLEPQLENAGFNDAYERSKNEAERVVRAHSQVLPIAVVRPSIVIEPPEAARRSALRLLLDLVASGLLPALPGAPTNTLDVIPVADAAAATARVTVARGAFGTFHIASGDRAPRVTDIVRVGARRPVRFVGQADLCKEAERLPSHDAIAPLIGALAYPKTFDTARTEAVLGAHPCGGSPLDALVPARRARVSGRLPAG